MQNAKELITKNLELIIKEIIGESNEIILEVPEDSRNGDYSSNIALKLAKKLGKTPRDIAEEIKSAFISLNIDVIDKVDVAGAGFLNFYLSKDYLITNLSSVLEEKDNYGKSKKLLNKKIMVEFTDPNPLKEFHIGHLYSNAVGESMARLLEFQGANVMRACYQGDVGMHVAKALFGVMNMGLTIDEVRNKSLQERAKFLGEAYALGAKTYEESEDAKEEIKKINKKVYDKDPEVFPLYEEAKKWSLEYFEEIYKRLGTHFDKYYFESEVGERGVEIVKENIGRVFEEESKAVIFPKEKSGLHTRVFINSLGLPTYEAKELGLAPKKYEDFSYDKSVIITGNEINEYFKVLLKALSLIYPDLAEKTHHISHGMVRLPSGKMSSRTGDVITGEWLLDETKKALHEAHQDMSKEVAEKLTVGAVKYALLKVGVGSDITFSFEESINLHGNSGPYLQYAYARTQSILNKVKSQNSKFKIGIQNSKLEKEEVEVLRFLIQFPDVVERAAKEFAPNFICTYLFELTQKFSLFYEKHRVVNAEENARDFRLALVSGVGQVLKNGLYLLGISTPEKI